MQNRKVLAVRIAGAVTLGLLVGTSAFAESRHQQGTNRASGGHIERGSGARSGGGYVPRERGVSQSPRSFEPRVTPRSDSPRYESRGNINRSWESRGNVQDRVQPRRLDESSRGSGNRDWRGNINRGYDSRGGVQPRSESRGSINRDSRGSINRDSRGSINRDSRGSINRDSRGSINRDSRGSINRGNESRGMAQRGTISRDQRGNIVIPRDVARDRFHHIEGWHGGSAPYRAHEFVRSYGRVDRIVRDRRGYRVWCGGLYPIFVPFDYWYRFPLRVGLFIRFGGYWDPFGYWSVYDYAPWDGYYYNDPYYYDRAYSSGVVHGVVESVDYRRGTLVINDDISRQFVTITMPRDRRMDDVRPGDYVEFSGTWRRGLFDADRLDRWDYGRDGDYDRGDRDGY